MSRQRRENRVVLRKVTNAFGPGLRKPLCHEFGAGLTFVVGESGIGKSTLLHIIGGILRPSGGYVGIDGRAIPDERDAAYQSFRRESVVVLHQDRNLIEHMTVAENVALSLVINQDYTWCDLEAARCLQRVELDHKIHHNVTDLSGGERQRVAIARAMASKARIVLADEPTGSLDPRRSREIFELLARLAEEERRTVIVVTHDHELAHDQVERGSGEVLELTEDGLCKARREAEPDRGSIDESMAPIGEPTGRLGLRCSDQVFKLNAPPAEKKRRSVVAPPHDHGLAHGRVEQASGEVLEPTEDGLREARREADPDRESIDEDMARTEIGSPCGGLQ